MAEKDKYIDEAYKELEQLSADERKRLEYEAGNNGVQRMAELNQRMIKENRMDDLVKASVDEAYRHQLFEELGI